jgi:polyhydroxybutyrate depolymerase
MEAQMTRIIFLALLLILPFPALAGLQTKSIQIDGMSRSYTLYIPARVANAPALVIVLHGGGGTGRQIMRNTQKRFNQLAERDGFVVAYPDAIDRIWDFGEGKVSKALEHPRNDLKFLTHMINQIDGRVGLNRARVFATGISRGGQASYFLGCKRPNLIRAIAPVAMPLPGFLKDDCRGKGMMPILLINGTADPIVPYGGGHIRLGRKDRGLVLSTARTMALFARKNRCGPGRHIASKGAVDMIRLTGCQAPTRLFRVNGGGHTWPGGGRSMKRIVGPVNRDINAADEVWNFFRQLR